MNVRKSLMVSMLFSVALLIALLVLAINIGARVLFRHKT